MTLSTAPYKGTRDFYPEDMRVQRWMFGRLREAVQSFGYLEYDGPMLEPFELYASKTSEEIVNQQLYWLMDRGERKLAVRPEMTPTLARMVAAKLHELPKPIRWFSIPNLWRYERPQRGRLREHWQLNVDVLGGDVLLADAEILQVAYAVMKQFHGETKIEVRVNHRGLINKICTQNGIKDPKIITEVIRAYDEVKKIGADKVKARLLEKAAEMNWSCEAEVFDIFGNIFGESAKASQILKDYDCEGSQHLKKLFDHLKMSGVNVRFDPSLMRGFDYYTGMVFEVYDTSPENNRAMFGGGRYDNLIGLFGKDHLSGVGFGMGDVTLRNFLETHALLPKFESTVDVFVTLPDLKFRETAESIAAQLRAGGLSVITPLSVGGFGAQLKQASKQGARYAILFGDEEWARGEVLVKDLAQGTQESFKKDEILSQIKKQA